MTTSPNSVPPHGGLIDALHVAGPATDLADKLMLFGRFVGSWGSPEWTGTDPAGQPATMHGELHFGWSSAAEPCKTSGSSPDGASPARAGRPRRSTARRSASTTPRSTPGAPHGSNPSTAASDASSVDPSTTTSSCSATRQTPQPALAVHRHHARLLPLARRELTRRLRYLELRRGDARHPRRARTP